MFHVKLNLLEAQRGKPIHKLSCFNSDCLFLYREEFNPFYRSDSEVT